MYYNIITLDAFNNNANIVLSGVSHLFKSYVRFVELTNFNFPNTLNVSYEPDRNLFMVERKGGVILSGENLEEIVWCRDNIDNIIAAAYADGYGELPPGPDLRQIRDAKLYETDWMITRHNEQIQSNLPTTLTNEQYTKLLKYRQDLRDITTKYTSMDDVVWPLLDIL